MKDRKGEEQRKILMKFLFHKINAYEWFILLLIYHLHMGKCIDKCSSRWISTNWRYPCHKHSDQKHTSHQLISQAEISCINGIGCINATSFGEQLHSLILIIEYHWFLLLNSFPGGGNGPQRIYHATLLAIWLISNTLASNCLVRLLWIF